MTFTLTIIIIFILVFVVGLAYVIVDKYSEMNEDEMYEETLYYIQDKEDKLMNEDEEIFELMYKELEDFYYTVGDKTMFYEVKDEMTNMVQKQLGMDETDAYKFVCKWFDNRH